LFFEEGKTDFDLDRQEEVGKQDEKEGKEQQNLLVA
jgi:hypothetical protein